MKISDYIRHIASRDWYDIILEIQNIKKSLNHIKERLKRPQDLDPSDITDFRKDISDLVEKLDKLELEEKNKIEEMTRGRP